MRSFFRQQWSFILLSFALPVLLMLASYTSLGIYWQSDLSILTGDAYHQYVNFYGLFNQTLHGNGGWFYTFTSGGGLNLFAFSAYYLSSFFVPLIAFFDNSQMPDVLYLLTLFKFGLMGMSSFVAFKHLAPKAPRYLILTLSTAYSLMSFVTSQSEIIMWLDVFIWLPLVLWGLDRLLTLSKPGLYLFSLSCLFLQNYYFGFMIAIFLVLLFTAKLIIAPSKALKKCLDFGVSSLSAGLIAMAVLLPVYLDLRNNGETLTKVNSLLTENSWGLDLLAKNFVASYDTTQYGAVPMIYVGLIPLIFAVIFFLIRRIPWHHKLAYGFIFLVLIASFYCRALDLFWQGMHAPNMFLHRYSFLFSILIILVALDCLAYLPAIRLRHYLGVISCLALAISATYFTHHYTYLTWITYLLTGLFLLAYGILFTAIRKNWLPVSFFCTLLAFFAISEAGINAYFMTLGIKNEWGYSSRHFYDDTYQSESLAANRIPESNQFFRTEFPDPDTANDGMKFNLNALSQFSSVRNRKSSSTLNLLGFKSEGTNLNLRYPANTLLMDNLLGIRYNIDTSNPNKFGFDFQGNNLYKNQYALQPAIFVPGGYKDAVLSDASHSIHNQTVFANQLTNQETSYFTQFYTLDESTNGSITANHNRITLTKQKEDKEALFIRYKVKVKANSQAYLNIHGLSYQNADQKNMTLSVANVTRFYNTDDTGSLFNLGYYAHDTELVITLLFPDNDYVSFDRTAFWQLDCDKVAALTHQLDRTPLKIETVNNGLRMQLSSSQKGDLVLTVPYDKGWHAKVDGKSTSIKAAQTGFMKISLTPGKHKIQLYFIPQGLKLGLGLSAIGLLLATSYLIYIKKSTN